MKRSRALSFKRSLARRRTADSWPFEASASGLHAQIRLERLAEPEVEFMFHPERKWLFDFAWPDRKIAVEYQGGLYLGYRGGHQTAKGSRRDWQKFNEAQRLGWRVLQFGPDETRDGTAGAYLKQFFQEDDDRNVYRRSRKVGARATREKTSIADLPS